MVSKANISLESLYYSGTQQICKRFSVVLPVVLVSVFVSVFVIFCCILKFLQLYSLYLDVLDVLDVAPRCLFAIAALPATSPHVSLALGPPFNEYHTVNAMNVVDVNVMSNLCDHCVVTVSSQSSLVSSHDLTARIASSGSPFRSKLLAQINVAPTQTRTGSLFPRKRTQRLTDLQSPLNFINLKKMSTCKRKM